MDEIAESVGGATPGTAAASSLFGAVYADTLATGTMIATIGAKCDISADGTAWARTRT
jgi:hypothetical protein